MNCWVGVVCKFAGRNNLIILKSWENHDGRMSSPATVLQPFLLFAVSFRLSLLGWKDRRGKERGRESNTTRVIYALCTIFVILVLSDPCPSYLFLQAYPALVKFSYPALVKFSLGFPHCTKFYFIFLRWKYHEPLYVQRAGYLMCRNGQFVR